MTTEQWLLAAVTASWSANMISLAVGRWLHKTEHQVDAPLYRIQMLENQLVAVAAIPVLVHRVTELEKRVDQAGKHTSDLASAVQGLPERLRHTFVTREEWNLTERRRRPEGGGERDA